jgi:hypothetical protein
MMNLEQIKARMPEYARDIKLNLSSVLGGTGTPGPDRGAGLRGRPGVRGRCEEQ